VHFWQGWQVDPEGILPVIGQVLVDEDRDHPAAAAEHGDGLFEESPLGIDSLAGLRPGVVAVLGHEQHANDGQLISTQSEGLGHGRSHGESVLL